MLKLRKKFHCLKRAIAMGHKNINKVMSDKFPG